MLKGTKRLINWHVRDDILMLLSKHVCQTGFSFTRKALHDVVLWIQCSLACGQHILSCFLHIQRSFDNVSVQAIKRALASKCVDENYKLACFHVKDKKSTFICNEFPHAKGNTLHTLQTKTSVASNRKW